MRRTIAPSLLIAFFALGALLASEPAHPQRRAPSTAPAYRLTGLTCLPQPFDGSGIATCRLTFEKVTGQPAPGHGAVLSCEPAASCPFQGLSLPGGLPVDGPAGRSFQKEIRLARPGTPPQGFDWQNGRYRLTGRISTPTGPATEHLASSFVVSAGATSSKASAAPAAMAAPTAAAKKQPARGTRTTSRRAEAQPAGSDITKLRPDLVVELIHPQLTGGAPRARVRNVGVGPSPPVQVTYTCKRWCDHNFQVACTSSPPPPFQTGILQPGQSAEDILGSAIIGLDDAGCDLTYQLGATVDPNGQATETDETNNTDYLQFGL